MTDRNIDKHKRQPLLGWPSWGQWKALADSLQGKLFEVLDPFAKCREGPAACEQVLKNPENPFFTQDTPGGHSSEMSYFSADWQNSLGGDNDPRLLALKHKYDPTGLFLAHHYVGSEGWRCDVLRSAA